MTILRPRSAYWLALGWDRPKRSANSTQKVVPVVVVKKYFPALDSPHDNLVQRIGGVYSVFSRHSSRS
jgi:hypothetical protein